MDSPDLLCCVFLGEARVSRGTTAGEHQQDGGGGKRTSGAQVFTGDARAPF